MKQILFLIKDKIQTFLKKTLDRFKRYLEKLRKIKIPRRTKIRIIAMALTCIFVLLAIKVHYTPLKKERPKAIIEKADFLYEKGNYRQAESVYKEIVREIPQEEREREWIYYQLGNCHKNMNSLEEAISSYEAFIQRYPKSDLLPEVKYNLALCYEEIGNVDKASQILRKLIEQFPENEIVPEAYLRLGDCLRKKDKKTAISTYQKIIKMYPKSSEAPLAYLNIGDIYLEQQRYSEAILHYTSLLQKYPQFEEGDRALFNLSRCYLSRDEVDKALSFLFLLIENFPESNLRDKSLLLIGEKLKEKKDYEKAIKVFQEIQRMYPDSPILIARARESIAEIYLIQKNFPQAIKVYESILSDYPYLANAEEIYLRLAHSYKDNGDYKMASLVLEKFVNYFPLSSSISSVYITLGECLFKQNLYLEGIRAFQRAIENPCVKKEEVRQAYLFLGEGYLSMGLLGKALEAFSQALPSSYGRKRLEVQLRIAECYLRKGDLSSAKDLLLCLLSELPKYNPSSQEYLKIGDLLSTIGEEKNALQMYKKANGGKIKLKEKISILYRMARIEKKLGDVRSAAKLYYQIINLSKNDSSYADIRRDSLFYLGDIYYSLKKYKEASSFYAKGIEEDSESEKISWGLYQLGNCHRHLGDLKKAREFYQKLIKDFPEAFWTDMARTFNEVTLVR